MVADDLMTLEDFLAKTDTTEDDKIKMPIPLDQRLSNGNSVGEVKNARRREVSRLHGRKE